VVAALSPVVVPMVLPLDMVAPEVSLEPGAAEVVVSALLVVEVVAESELAAELSLLLPQAVNTPATAKIAKNFFIIICIF
jgi:hypothetical protein